MKKKMKTNKLHPLDGDLLAAALSGSYSAADQALENIEALQKKRGAMTRAAKFLSLSREEDPMGILAKDAKGQTPLMLGARSGKVPLMLLLLERCSNEPESLACERQAFVQACADGDLEMVKAFMDARVRAGKPWGALDELVDRGDHQAKSSPVASAIEGGSHACLKMLLAAGFSAGGRVEGLSMVALAIHYDRPEMVGTLLKAGAHPIAADSYQVTPLMSAACKGFSGVIQDLLAVAKDQGLNAADSTGTTALGYALMFKKVESARLISAAGGVLEGRGREGNLLHAKGRAAVARARVVALGEGMAPEIGRGCKENLLEQEARQVEDSTSSDAPPVQVVALALPVGPVGPVGIVGAKPGDVIARVSAQKNKSRGRDHLKSRFSG